MATGAIATPYYASDLPVPLPTEDEIEAAPEVAAARLRRRIVQVNDHMVVKFGVGVELAEGANMIFVRENTKIPVPQVYALYSKEGKNYIVMQRVIGQTLLTLWPELDSTAKETICATLRAYMTELRALPSPQYYGSLGKRQLLDSIFWTDEPDAAINGPFASDGELIEAMARKYTYDGRSGYRADFYRQCLPNVLGGHSPVFTHGDLQRKNILVRRLEADAADAQAPAQWQVTMLDWETSGWYPSYWEYSQATWSLRWDNDWCLWVGKVLDPYVAEAAWMQDICLELWS